MSLVTIAGVSKSHAAQHLFSDVGLMISAGRRIAVVGMERVSDDASRRTTARRRIPTPTLAERSLGRTT